MSKKPIFISYSHSNLEMVELLVEEIEKSEHFEALVIASLRRPLKSLTDKVMEGISKSHAIIPILTEQSINTQWVNQEIGYAHGKDKIIRPIVEHKIRGELKGFIHKGLDLPYSFNVSKNHVNFLSVLRTLLADLHKSVDKPIIKATINNVTPIDKIREKVRKHRLAEEKKVFFNSLEGAKIGKSEFEKIFTFVQARAKEINLEGGLLIEVERKRNSLDISFGANHASIIFWGHYVGHLFKITISQELLPEGINHRTLGVRPQIWTRTYFINSEKNVNGWRFETRESDFYTSEEIVDLSFQWLIEQVVPGTN